MIKYEVRQGIGAYSWTIEFYKWVETFTDLEKAKSFVESRAEPKRFIIIKVTEEEEVL